MSVITDEAAAAITDEALAALLDESTAAEFSIGVLTTVTSP